MSNFDKNYDSIIFFVTSIVWIPLLIIAIIVISPFLIISWILTNPNPTTDKEES